MAIIPPDTNTATQSGLAVKYESTQATSKATFIEVFPGVKRLRIEGTIPARNISSAMFCSPLTRFDKAKAADCTTVGTGD